MNGKQYLLQQVLLLIAYTQPFAYGANFGDEMYAIQQGQFLCILKCPLLYIGI